MPDEAPSPIAGYRPTRRYVELDLPEPYEGVHVTVWANAPLSLRMRLVKPESDEDLAAVWGQIVVGHNLLDFDGKPLPPATDPDFYYQMPGDLMPLLLQAILDQYGRLSPKRAG